MIKNKIILLIFVLFVSQFLFAQTAPDAQDDNYTTATNTTLNTSLPGVLTNDTDADGDSLVITEYLISGVVYLAGETASFTEGTIVLNSDGSFTFVPATNYNGNVPVINYTVSDGVFTDTANLIISIINAAPNARNDYDTANINTTLTVSTPGVLVNDTDSDNDSLSVVEFTVNGITVIAGGTIPIAQGTITINAEALDYEPTSQELNYVTGNRYELNFELQQSSEPEPEPPVEP